MAAQLDNCRNYDSLFILQTPGDTNYRRSIGIYLL